MTWWVALALGAALGAAPVVALRGWLAGAAYRYADELDRPRRRTGWLMPAATGTGAALAGAWAPRPWVAVVYAACAGPLVILAAIDADVQRLPNQWTKPSWIVVPVALLGVAVAEGNGLQPWWRALVAGVALGMAYLALALLGGASGIGAGDVKLAPSLGALLGFLSVTHVLASVVVTFLVGGVAALVLLLRGRGRKARFAFGPFMILGAVLVLAGPLVGRLVGRLVEG
ncbi:MAG TPA: A24 family peptidase [Phycicoccus sp.]|nr:A24 family peptidase [Phycicoccus sp.]